MNKKQKTAILAIVVVTALLGALILVLDRPQSSGNEAEPSETHATAETANRPQDSNAHEGEAGHRADEEKPIVLNEAQIAQAGIKLATSGPATIASTIQLPAEIKFNQDRTAHIVPRVTGIVESVSADLGQQVKKGQLLATISSTVVSDLRSDLLNAEERLALARATYKREKQLWEEKISAQQDYLQAQQALREAEIAARNARQKLTAIGASANTGALNRFELRAPFDGMVVEKHISQGESVREDLNVFTVSDLSTVWAEISVPAHQLDAVRVGESAVVRATSFDSEAKGRVSYVGALLGEQTRTATARIVLPNPKGAWRPGLFANVEIASGEFEVPLAVLSDAIQSVEEKPTVFVRVPQGFIPVHVETGRSDVHYVEIVEGLQQGVSYAATGSFVLKAEQGKNDVEHEH